MKKFPDNEWKNLNKSELTEYINSHISEKPEKWTNDYYSHEYYIVLSHLRNRLYDDSNVETMHYDLFKGWYNIAVQVLIHHGIWSNDKVLKLMS